MEEAFTLYENIREKLDIINAKLEEAELNSEILKFKQIGEDGIQLLKSLKISKIYREYSNIKMARLSLNQWEGNSITLSSKTHIEMKCKNYF